MGKYVSVYRIPGSKRPNFVTKRARNWQQPPVHTPMTLIVRIGMGVAAEFYLKGGGGFTVSRKKLSITANFQSPQKSIMSL